MSNKPFDRMIVNPRERLVSPDLNTLQTQLDLATRTSIWQAFNRRSAVIGTPTFETKQQQLVDPLDAGFHGNSFRVNASSPAAMNVTVEAGLGWYNDASTATSIGSIVGLDDPSNFKPLWNPARATISVPAADLALARIDIVEVIASRALGDLTVRDILNTGTGIFAPTSVNKTLSYGMSTSVNGASGINYKTGTPNAVPAAPAPSAGYVKIAEVYVDAAIGTISQLRIADFRALLLPNGSTQIVALLNCSASPGSMSVIYGAPGFNICVAYNGASGSQWYIAGGSTSKFLASLSIRALGVAGITFLQTGGTSVTLTSALAASFNNPANVTPAVSWGTGQQTYQFTAASSATTATFQLEATFTITR